LESSVTPLTIIAQEYDERPGIQSSIVAKENTQELFFATRYRRFEKAIRNQETSLCEYTTFNSYTANSLITHLKGVKNFLAIKYD
jgi:hypothetical protein